MRTVTSQLTVGVRIPDAASGVAVAQPGGIPVTYVRNSAGRYSVYFPFGWILLTATATPDFSVSNTVARAVVGGGNVLSTAIDTGAAGTPTNSTHLAIVTLQPRV